MRKIISIRAALIILLALLTTWSIAFAHGEKHKSIDTKAGVSYTRDILPIFEKNCASCHGSKSPEHTEYMANIDEYQKQYIGPRMDNYTLISSFVGWPETGSLMRNLDDGTNTEDGKPGKMYVHLGVSEQERKANLELFKAWVGNWTLKGWAEISKDELDSFQLNP